MNYAKVRPTKYDGTKHVLRLKNPNHRKEVKNGAAKLYLKLKYSGKLPTKSSLPTFKLRVVTYKEWMKEARIKVLGSLSRKQINLIYKQAGLLDKAA